MLSSDKFKLLVDFRMDGLDPRLLFETVGGGGGGGGGNLPPIKRIPGGTGCFSSPGSEGSYTELSHSENSPSIEFSRTMESWVWVRRGKILVV